MSSYGSALSDWYELVEGRNLMQGDLLEGCPVFRPPTDLKWPVDETIDELDFTLGRQDMVILSQSCDLAQGQKPDLWLVLLCPIWRLSEAAALNPFLASSYGKEECRRGHMTGYHMVAGCGDERWQRETSIVSFREVWSLPLEFIRNMALAMGPRARIRHPYREHLAQAFARYFMRVGLPADIPPFRSDKAETEALKRLAALDEEARRRVLDALL